MSKTIYKYTVPIDGEVYELDLPRPCEILYVGTVTRDTRDGVQFWAEVTPGSELADTRRRRFTVVGTGHPLPAGSWHKGTVICPPFVWHLLELDS